jgi:DNA repair exonuclease SbcCD ATPase subunit
MNKKVIIKRLQLVNFKGLRNVEIEFSDNVTTISGRNGTGKTTLKDAFCWLLWGKNSEGDTDSKFGIKTTDENGNFIPDLEHGVTGVFEVVNTETGEVENVELRRVLVEEWKVPTGETGRVLKGHHTDFFYNGVPLKTKAEYEARINAIIPEAVFKIITDPYYFLTLHWKAQREMLLQIAGNVSDEDIARGNERFALLLAQLTGKTLEDYKREVSARKAKVNEQLAKIPTAIDAITRVTPEEPDYKALGKEKEVLEAEISQIDESVASAAEANRIAYDKAAKIQAEINAKRTQQQKLLFEAKDAARNEAYKKNETYNNAERELRQIEAGEQNESRSYNAERNRLQSDIKRAETTKQGYTIQQDELREKWYSVNAEEFTESDNLVCPLFKHVCADAEALQRYETDRAEARNKFYENKEKRLADINNKGGQLTEQIAAQEAEINRLYDLLAQEEEKHQAAVADYANRRAKAEKTISVTPKVSTDPDIKGEDIPEWVTLQEEINELSGQLPKMDASNANDTAELRKKKTELMAKLDEVKRKLNLRDTIDTNNKRIKELREEAALLAQEKANLQTEETTIDDFVTAQMNEVERRVNSLFSRVQFKMYRTQIEDAKQVPDCICYIDGVRYSDKNAAGKVNAGLDVINTLCAFHEVSAPIFVDEAESVNEFIPVNSQLIKLEVTKGDFTVNNF